MKTSQSSKLLATGLAKFRRLDSQFLACVIVGEVIGVLEQVIDESTNPQQR